LVAARRRQGSHLADLDRLGGVPAGPGGPEHEPGKRQRCQSGEHPTLPCIHCVAPPFPSVWMSAWLPCRPRFLSPFRRPPPAPPCAPMSSSAPSAARTPSSISSSVTTSGGGPRKTLRHEPFGFEYLQVGAAGPRELNMSAARSSAGRRI